MKTQLVVADEHESVRQMLALSVSSEGVYEVVGEARTGFEALQACRRHKPQVFIGELLLPELGGVQVIRTLRAEMRETRVLIFSGANCRELILPALRVRPHGFVHKRDSLPVFLEALRAVSAGCCYFTPFATRLLDEAGPETNGHIALTERQRAVLQMIAEGMSSKLMADRLGIATKTVEHYRAQLMERLGLHDVARLTRYAVGLGMVPADC